MNKIKSMLFLAMLIATAATTTLATDGQIPIGGRPGYEPTKTTAETVITINEPKSEISGEISDYLWTIISIIDRF